MGEDFFWPENAADPGVILHQPLSLHFFRKNGQKQQKMNGPPVCPGRKTENAPTWRPRSPVFGTPFLAHFLLIFLPSHPLHHHNQPSRLLFFIILNLNQHWVRDNTTNIHFLSPTNTQTNKRMDVK